MISWAACCRCFCIAALANAALAADTIGQSPQLPQYKIAIDVVRGTPVSEPNAIYRGRGLAMVQNRLVVLEGRGENAGVILGASKNSRACSFGTVGPLNSTFSSTWSVFPDDVTNGKFWVLDFNKARLFRLDVNDACKTTSNIFAIQLSDTLVITAPVWGANGLLYSPGLFNGRQLAVIDRTGKTLRSIGPEIPGDASHPIDVRAHAYQSVTATNPDHTLIVVATRYADRLTILSLDGEVVAEGQRPFHFEPQYRVVKGLKKLTVEFDDDVRFGYISIATTTNAIYALFSGKTHEDSGIAATGSIIHIFDWRGNFVGVMQLNADLSAITADSKEEILFGTKITGSGGVFQYAVPAKFFHRGGISH